VRPTRVPDVGGVVLEWAALSANDDVLEQRNRDEALIGGREKRKLVLSEYDTSWLDRYRKERERIVGALGPAAVRVEHIGSTSVPGLPAKPIVDILVAVEDADDDSHVSALEKAGYVLRVREPGHRMVRTPGRDVHVHVFPAGSEDERLHLLFVEWLRHDREDREKYEALKRELIAKDWDDMNQYAQAKSQLVHEILERAEAWAAETGWTPSRSWAGSRYG
jgi:GrpB-like predicted nucleotidyltransferase (UPF0157 family)